MVSLGDERFELLRPVGAGAFGVVYQALDRADGSHVAIKVLQATDKPDGRFGRETALLAELRHPSIVRYVAHGRTPAGENYLVMEWLEGQTLDTRLEAGPLSIDDTLIFARRVVSGLTMAERKGVVHRDLKPANLFLVGGQLAEAKILDFGLARRIEETQALTRTGLAVGTPLYMSPEQAHGARGIDSRSDVFALGSVLYECLTGSAPFEGPSALATLAKICIEEAPRIEQKRGDLPPRLVKLLHSMLAKDIAARPTWRVVAEELEQIRSSGAPSIPMRAASGDWTGRPSLRPRVRPRALCAIFLGQSEQELAAPDLAGPLEPAPDGESLARTLAVDPFDQKLGILLRTYGARCERLLDGSRILLLERAQAPAELAVAAAQCALALRQLRRDAPIVLCTARAALDGNVPIGELMARGAALLAEVPPGSVLADDESAALLEMRFELHGVGARTFIARERVAGEAPCTCLGQNTPFVGRDRELDRLEAVYGECTGTPARRAVLVSAAAGAGKSRLRHEFLQRLTRGSARFALMIARGDPMRRATRFGLLAPAIRALAEITANDGEETAREKLRARLARLFPPDRVASLAPFLGELVGAPFPDEEGSPLEAARRDAQLMEERLASSWLAWLEAECQLEPLVLCVEDLQWADGASMRLLEAALRALDQRAFMLLALARPEVHAVFPGLRGLGINELVLPKLPPEACERLLDAVSGSQLNDAVRAALVERADGNPLFLEELVRGVGDHRGEQLSESLLETIRLRLEGLGEEAKLLVRAASVFGQVFRVDGMQALLGMDAYRMDVTGWLRVLCEREVIFARGDTSESEYAFRHALIRDAAYLLLPDDQKRFAHRLAGEWLERNGHGEPAVLAAHRALADARTGS